MCVFVCVNAARKERDRALASSGARQTHHCVLVYESTDLDECIQDMSHESSEGERYE